MVFADSPEGRRRAALAAVERNRRLWTQRLGGEFREVAGRLLDVYERLLPELELLTVALGDPDNPVYRNVETAAEFDAIEDLRRGIIRDLRVLESAVSDEAAALQSAGIRTGVQSGAELLNAGGVGIQFNQPLVQAIEASIDYVDSPAFQSAVGRLGVYHADQVGDLIIAGIAQGRNPREIAALVSDYFVNRRSPLNDAYNLVQTTHVYSARRGVQEVFRETGVEQWVWSANIGSPRTCRACVAMHGTRHPVDEVLNDHHRGRCAMVPVTPTWAQLGFAGGVDPVIEPGVEWFNRQPADVQREVIGNNALFEAIQRGEVQFSPETIVGTYENDIFGEMRRARSYREIVNNPTP